ncbi:hypothetical protein [Lactiplantibacillus herbarum]|uniref:hypothetical protein n=1 Tax=Lactiplantibacillus herbarum TaxID=1670446 RepID=UPI000650008A|nr:hypothetical protein [Lactiplantibacillus herbarum]
MKIKPITTDEQWFQYLRRAERTDDHLLGFIRLMMNTYPSGNWIRALHTRGRKYKQNRFYYDGLTPERRYECFNRYFKTAWGKEHRFFQGWE